MADARGLWKGSSSAGATACPVQGSKFGVALSWDPNGVTPVDLDLQAVAFSKTGKLMDAVYYNNLKALGRGLTHSGDEMTGAKKGFDECIWVHIPRLPEDVQLVAFVVACYKGGSLSDAKNAKLHLLADGQGHEVGRLGLEQRSEKAALVGSLQRSDKSWVFRPLDVPARWGQHFIDILEPTIGDFVRSAIPGAPRKIKAAFAMEKGSVVDLPQSSEMGHAFAGLGWDTTMGEVDLDVSAILLDESGSELECCFFGNEETSGVKHSGDNLTGNGTGDGEVIFINLEGLSDAVEQIFFVVNIYTAGRTFAMVGNPYCRIVTADGEEFCRYQLREAGHEQALIMARLFKEPKEARWSFQAIGMPCRGKTYKDSMPMVVQYARMRPADLALWRSNSSSTEDEFRAQRSRSASMEPLIVEGKSEKALCSQNCCVC